MLHRVIHPLIRMLGVPLPAARGGQRHLSPPVRRSWTARPLLVAVVTTLLLVLAYGYAVPPPAVEAVPGNVVISQISGSGGNTGATFTHDLIELFNRSAGPVNLTGWSVQYASATGSTWQVAPLSGTLNPGQYFLV